MPLSLITLLIVAVVCLLLGGIAGVLLGSSGGEQEEETGTNAEEAPPGGRKGRYAAVARLWREKTNGSIVVEVDGKSYLAPDPLRPDQRERLEQIAREFYTWIVNANGELPVPARPPAQVMQPVSEQAQQPVRQAPPPVVEKPQPADSLSPVVSAPPAASVTPNFSVGNPAAPITPPPVTSRPVSPGRAAPPVTPPTVKEGPKTMVEQIDAILKSMIVGTPYEMKGLSLTEDPRRGVMVWIGTTSYEGIGGVPDPEVQEILRAAVAEWERREESDRRRMTG